MPEGAIERPATRKRASAHGKHLYLARRRGAPVQSVERRLSAFGRGGEGLFPWSIYTYPGLFVGVGRLFEGRAAGETVRDWIRGRRRAPQWALVLLAAAIERRIAELAHVLELVRVEAAAREPKAKPGDGTGQP